MDIKIEKTKTIIEGQFKLDAEIYTPQIEQKLPAILISHGFLSTKEEFGELPQNLASKGYIVITYDFRGHGKSEGIRGLYTSQSHLDDIERAFNLLLSQKNIDKEKIALIGHSMGCTATIRFITESKLGKNIKTAILLAPPRKISDGLSKFNLTMYKFISNTLGTLFQKFNKHLYLPYIYTPKDLFINPDSIKKAEELNFLQKNVHIKNYKYMMEEIDNESFAKNITTPTLVVVAKKDKIIANNFSKQIFDVINSPIKEYKEIENSGHSMVTDESGELVEKIIMDWLGKFI